MLPPPRASVLIKAASGRCSINSRHIQLHQLGRPRAPACRDAGTGCGQRAQDGTAWTTRVLSVPGLGPNTAGTAQMR